MRSSSLILPPDFVYHVKICNWSEPRKLVEQILMNNYIYKHMFE